MAETVASRAPGHQGFWKPVVFAFVVLIAALISRTGLIGYAPIYDELYQLIPAESLLANNGYAVLDGVYDRARLHTTLIAVSFQLMGNTELATARLIPSVIPGALLVLLVSLWARSVIGPMAGWITAMFLLFWPNGIEVSQYIRFYALHGIFFVPAALMTYYVFASNEMALRGRIALLLGALPLLAVALHLQMLTMIGVGALGLWVAIVFLPGWLQRYRWMWAVLIVGACAVAAVLLSGIFTDQLIWLWTTYRWEPWPAQTDMFFYHRSFRDNYPTFWPLFPIAALIALRAYPRPASFCLIMFAATFVLQSFGGLKNIRYLYTTMPFFFVLWAAALQVLAPMALRYLREVAALSIAPFVPRFASGAIALVVLAVSAVFVIGANAAFERSTRLITGAQADLLLDKRRWAWPDATEMAAPWLADGAVVVTSEEMLAVRWLGDFDLAYNKPRFSELLYRDGPDTPAFSIDRRTGRPVIGELEDLVRVVACEPVGIFVFNASGLGTGLPFRIAEISQAIGAKVTAERRSGMALVGWRREPYAPTPRSDYACDTLPVAAENRAATRLTFQ